MKKMTLTLLIILGLSVAMNAQIFVGGFEYSGILAIPSSFTSNGHSNLIVISGEDHYDIYDNDLTTCLSSFNFIGLNDLNEDLLFTYMDLSEGTPINDGGSRLLFLTQTLFNTDDNYEYIEKFETGWYIKSTDGTILQTINVEEGYHASSFTVTKMDELYYILIRETIWGSQMINKMLIYRIDQSQGLIKVETNLPISVFPSIANRSQQITVELGEGNNATEVTVVNGLGQVIKRMPIKEGQHEVTISARELNSGLNVINTRSEKGQGSCKIIVQ